MNKLYHAMVDMSSKVGGGVGQGNAKVGGSWVRGMGMGMGMGANGRGQRAEGRGQDSTSKGIKGYKNASPKTAPLPPSPPVGEREGVRGRAHPNRDHTRTHPSRSPERGADALRDPRHSGLPTGSRSLSTSGEYPSFLRRQESTAHTGESLRVQSGAPAPHHLPLAC
jgi:hypothetical protein